MNWERVDLGNFVDFFNGKSIKPHGIGEYPAFGSNGLIGYSENFLYTDGIILGRVGAYCGAVEISKTNFWASDNTIVVKPKSNADLIFLYYLLKNFPLNNYAGGAAQPLITQTVLKPLPFQLPPLPTQRKIASILSAYDDLIENNLKRIKLLEESAFLKYSEIVRSEKLEKNILSNFGEIITGKTPSTIVLDYFGDDVPFIKTPDMHNQIFIENTVQNLSELGAKSQEKKFLPPLSLCVSCIGTAGVVGITSRPSQTNQQLNSIVFFEPRNVYYFYALMSKMKEQLDALGSNGSTFTNVNKNKFENMEVLVPNKKVLNEFAGEFEAPFKMILILQKQNTKLREARDILLPKLMNGQIEV
ncbi:Predicted nucleotidyltransferases [Candidatus Methylobacter favarea]|uniref:Predicted nucleotidyltransferases n=1 Tax=Candidatus Methylobacter favarea TaxID=2707345 RepID=A0A8S0Y9Y2_9GAMM|nr:restriction endonuclease subunit S [Candidatus Methylobacter favarea]CAA9890831.1 Predicted nucleotidyltransferases [Candidatus Methylobacter favarea]